MAKVLFVGYGSFKSKAGNDCFLIKVLTPPKISDDKSRADAELVSIFTEEEKYNKFIKTNGLMTECDVSVSVIGTRVKYEI